MRVPVRIRLARRDEILAVARAMRAEDAREIAAGAFDASPEALAAELEGPGRLVFVAARAAPVAILAVVWRGPRAVDVAMFATEAFPTVAWALTRWVRRRLVPFLLARGVIRAECRSIAGHDAAHRWLAALGAEREAVLPDCGSGRETFVQFAWTLTRLEGDRPCA